MFPMLPGTIPPNSMLSRAYAEGVNCVACNTIEAYHGITDADGGPGRLGTLAYSFARDHLQGPNGAFNGLNPTMALGSRQGLRQPLSAPGQSSPVQELRCVF